jgi:hypothetical protein
VTNLYIALRLCIKLFFYAHSKVPMEKEQARLRLGLKFKYVKYNDIKYKT